MDARPVTSGGTAPRVRVMHVVQDLGLGGLQQVVSVLAATLDPARFEVEVLCTRTRGAFAADLEQRGVPIHLLPFDRSRPDRLAFLKAARILRERRIDVVHSHNTDAFITGTIGGRLARVPTLVHTDHARIFPDRLRYMVAEHLLSRLVHRVVGVSQKTSEDLHRFERIPWSRLVTIENGIDGERFRRPVDTAAKRREIGIPANAFTLGLASRFSPEKGLDLLLRALAAAVGREPRLHLALAGAGEQEADLRRLAEELGMAERVHFLGLRKDVPELMATFDAYVISSHSEGLPMGLLEAMAARCPVVSTRVGGIPGAVEHRVHATLVPPGDVRALADALVELSVDGALRARYRDAAERRFDQRFSAEVMTRRYEALYLRCPLGQPGQ